MRTKGRRIERGMIVLGVGIAVGQALHDNPKTGGSISFEQTESVPSVPPGSTATP